MKKIALLLCAFTLIFTSCGNDDDDTPPAATVDQYVGTWTFLKYIENDEEQPAEPCDLEETIVISENGSYSNVYFEEDNSGNCNQEDSISGTWENVGNGNYALTYDGETDTLQVFFEDNTFYVLEETTFGDETFEIKIVYIRN